MANILTTLLRPTTTLFQRSAPAIANETKLILLHQENQALNSVSTRSMSSYNVSDTTRGFPLVERRVNGDGTFVFASSSVLSQHYRNNFFTSRIKDRSYSPVYHEQRRWYSNQAGNPSSGNTSSRDTHNRITNSPGAQQTDNRRWHDNRRFYVGGGSVLLLAGLFLGTYLYCENNDEEVCNTLKEKLGIKKSK